ncbi:MULTISPECIES: AAA family ATPase [unclassified Streptomyces]|uniref:AAA family ATPase n=1 Tax=unclassified Streptomyces TaxID=2593676 RepID=UPI00278C474D|nr:MULTISPECIES: AAA family ATPase [unclassified Streptomyces]
MAHILAVSPAGEYTVTELARILGHSGGAVGNACETLVARGEAERSQDKPRMYRATATTQAAAQHVPAPARPPAAPRSKKPAPPGGPTAPALQAVPPSAPAGPVVRPNGQTYHPRSLASLPDVEALRRLREAGIPVLLYGPPGTGKTSLIEAAFEDLITVAGDGDTTVGDLIGEYTQDPAGGYTFVYGPLITAMTEGRALLLDDATLISPKVLAALYPAMDGRRQIQVKAHKGETITAADGFYVIAGHNPGVHGAILTEALASRFSVQVQVSSDYELATQLKINRTAVRIARNLVVGTAGCLVEQCGALATAPSPNSPYRPPGSVKDTIPTDGRHPARAPARTAGSAEAAATPDAAAADEHTARIACGPVLDGTSAACGVRTRALPRQRVGAAMPPPGPGPARRTTRRRSGGELGEPGVVRDGQREEPLVQRLHGLR